MPVYIMSELESISTEFLNINLNKLAVEQMSHFS